MKTASLTIGQQEYLDVFRILAAGMVLIGHSFAFYGVSLFKNQDHFAALQNIEVVMLFMLSGFLTAYSINQKNKNHSYTLAEFARTKTIRIMQEYIPALILIAVLDAIAISINSVSYSYYSTYNIQQFLGNVFMLQGTAINSIYPGNPFAPFGSGRPLWTMSIEWWLYFIFAEIYLIIANKEKIGIKTIIMLSVFIVMPFQAMSKLGLPFGMGILAYYMYDKINRIISISLFLISIIGFIYYEHVIKEAYTLLSFVLICYIFCSGLIVFQGRSKDEKRKERNRILSFISRSTFMLYLIHYSIVSMFRGSGWSISVSYLFGGGIVLSAFLGILMFYFFGEKKILTPVFNKLLPSNNTH